MAKLHTSVAQWGLVGGVRQDASDLVLVAPSPSRLSPEARKGKLVVVVEAEGDIARGRNACAIVAQTIHEAYYGDDAISITSSLRKAIKAANAALYQFNFDAPPHQRATVGVTCAVFHGRDLFIAQVPPAQAYIAHAGKLRAVPNPLAWTGGAQGGTALGYSTALGTSLGSEPEFFRSVLQPGDMVVLASSNIARLLGKAQAEQLIAFSDAATVAEALYQLCRRSSLPEAHVVAVEIMPELSAEARHSPLSSTGVSERGKLAAERVSNWVLLMSAEAKSALRRPKKDAATATPLPAEAEEPQTPVAVGREPEEPPFLPPPAPPGLVLEQAAAMNGGDLLDRVPVGDAEPLPLSAFIGEGNYGGIVRPPAVKREHRIDLGDNLGTPVDFAALPQKAAPPPPGLVERATLPLRAVIVHLLGGIANMPRRALRNRAFEGQPKPLRTKVRGLSYRHERARLPWINMLLIVGLLALLVIVGLQQNRRRDQSIVRRALDNVTQAVDAAEAATVDAAAQQRLQEAETALVNLRPLKQSGMITTTKTTVWQQYQDVLQRYDQARASINRIGVFDNIEVVATLPNPGAQASRVVLATDPATTTGLLKEQLYVLDRGNDGGTVYQLKGNTFQPLLAPGQTAGSIVAGKIRDLLWRDDNPMALDRDENPFNSVATAYLRGANGWLANRLQGSELVDLGPIPAASFGGNLYFWDNKKRQLLRYASGYYADLPSEWITQRGDAKLDKVVDVQIEGDVYLLQADGSIAVFRGGAYQRTLPPPKLAPPVQTITRFYVTPSVVDEATGAVRKPGYIFLLDTLNERVIQISKTDGAVVQQIQARDRGRLNGLMDLKVDGARNEIYLTNSNQILRARLPAPPAPRTLPSPPSTATP